MTIAILCDMCQDFLEVDLQNARNLIKLTNLMDEERATHLCDKCSKELQNWMNERYKEKKK